MILKFDKFLEARLSDILKVKSKGGISDEIQRQIDLDFDFTKNLTKYITLKQRVNKRKVQFTIKWNDRASHNIKDRIKDRTSFKSIEEFNDLFKYVVNEVFPKMVGKELISTGKYSIYIKEYDISMIIYFDINKYINETYEIEVKTILTGRKGHKVNNLIEI